MGSGRLVYACLVPHPPIIVPEVGGQETARVAATLQAMHELAAEVAAHRPEVLLFISPHSIIYRDAVAVLAANEFRGDLGQFGAPQVSFHVPAAAELAEAVVEHGRQAGVSMAEVRSSNLDHGVMVPLYFLQRAGLQVPVAIMGFGLLPVAQLYRLGRAINAAIQETGRDVALVASGDMSHRLLPSAPAGFNPQGEVFDRRIREAVAAHQVEEILGLPAELVELAGECGYRSLVMALGGLDAYQVEPEVLSYEGPFGVGYLVARWKITGPAEGMTMGQRWVRSANDPGDGAGRAGEETDPPIGGQEVSPAVRLARQALETYVRSKQVISPPRELPPELGARAGVFVSLKKQGQLRGCIGTTLPTCANVAEEIIRNALSAGLEDPRFPPVRVEELAELTYSVDVLQPGEPVHDLSELDPRRYGVIVRSGRRVGLLLPDLEGVDTAAEQIAIARQKAGIRPDEPYQIEKFTVVRYH
ncbi:MAG: AmmeMemoRadiSam system protein A [Clostridia bacterium]|nr:MAG: AmmeMemoRadiSam system protein A [Clostridia bacterium]